MINFDLKIKDFPFNEASQHAIETWRNNNHEYGSNWPVVYFIHNDESREAYIGETLNAGKRAAQHWQNKERQRLKVIHIMTDETFNKSVVLDLESFLIKYISADGKYKLQNGNSGLADFNYYAREEYEQEFNKIWDCLKELGLVQSGIADIQNSDLFKFSPYKSLTEDQQRVLEQILYQISGYLKFGNGVSLIVEGGAGTGKTILAVFLIKLLTDLNNNQTETNEIVEEADIGNLQTLISQKKKLRVGFIVPMQSLRETLRKVFSTINGLSPNMIYSPVEMVKAATAEPFDLLVCDESHRLRQRKSLSQYPAFDNANTLLGLPQDATELDWILKCSKMQLLFYDEEQSVKPSDIPAVNFDRILHGRSLMRIPLTSQLRCQGGNDYISYVKDILYNEPVDPHESSNTIMKEDPIPYQTFGNYELKLYENVDQMVNDINLLDQEYGLSCTVAGYAWKWISKGEPKGTQVRDINIGKGYLWNRTYTDWIKSDRLPYEVGCIHTVQGYDLNYVGVIFGPEITYNTNKKRVEIIAENYKDSLGKAVCGDMDSLREYIINIYATLMTRGIRGAFVYVCDPVLRAYLRRYFTDSNMR